MLTRRAFLEGAAKALAALGLARALPDVEAQEPEPLAIEGETLEFEPLDGTVLYAEEPLAEDTFTITWSTSSDPPRSGPVTLDWRGSRRLYACEIINGVQHDVT